MGDDHTRRDALNDSYRGAPDSFKYHDSAIYRAHYDYYAPVSQASQAGSPAAPRPGQGGGDWLSSGPWGLGGRIIALLFHTALAIGVLAFRASILAGEAFSYTYNTCPARSCYEVADQAYWTEFWALMGPGGWGLLGWLPVAWIALWVFITARAD